MQKVKSERNQTVTLDSDEQDFYLSKTIKLTQNTRVSEL
jgi:hypothetical protein